MNWDVARHSRAKSPTSKTLCFAHAQTPMARSIVARAMKSHTLLLVSVLLALGLAGCTETSSGDQFETPPMVDGAYVITMTADFKYLPKFAEVPAGSTVVFVNDSGSHNVVPEGHTAWQGTPVSSETGEHLRITINEPGDYDYFCQPHKSLGMVGTLRVA